ncbi:small nucleolar ribonucleoprotein complex subunit Utp14, putatrive [Metarhizium album ARSEF 1941]|uniref:Small nucleolar ribonucleoprotein complex subunit Utp14, putatrive n=1 Tax=Metarhizium album (strain ARSEF 1941) TaxID=1081103 RepID=A0A0B2X929_METAS|nr:small nucleolar ribonucleoprotein complex subunit Utp14, putatrive [Metarhizium album ARSEF 1941]KHO01796.1 small nucleolar ribonucleoprotein complex subunit Utp14, putatrive [Metarhizium album ARSEF 1941]
MPGRQSHGRPLAAAPKTKAGGKKSSKARSQKNALNAFGIAQDMYPKKQKKTPRARELDAEIERKHGRDEDEDEKQQPGRKKAKGPSPADGGGEDGSDSEGNEWRLGGLRDDDDDSEIESDDAFGDSDNEKFEEYSFRGSKSKPNNDPEDDSCDDQGETLGADAIDLATALDQWEEESDDEPQADDEPGSGDSEEEEDEDEDEDESEDEDDDDGAAADAEKLNALKGLISQYAGDKADDDEPKSSAGQKLSLGDLGLSGLKDPLMKKSLKLMNKEAKEKRPGAAKKLAVPLSRREQGRLDRSVAYDKTNETLDRWTETVKQNRRAEHLVFPLPQNSPTAGLDTSEIQPLSSAKPSNELESAVMSIMEQSGLSMNKELKPKPREYDEEGNMLSRNEALARKRMERELNSREAKRAKRIKKIKSKAYHRVHRKQRERDEIAAKEAMDEAGEIDSEEEREAQDRRRALERVGLRHKESKWAKIGSKTKRALWDDDFRTGLAEMARKDEELRRRKEGKAGVHGDSDSDATSSSGSDGDDDDDDDDRLRRQLRELEGEGEGEPLTKLMSMKFMQKAEAARKQADDDTIRQILRDLDGDAADSSSDAQADREVGRRSYGSADACAKPALETSARAPKRTQDTDVDITISKNTAAAATKTHPPEETPSSTTGAWSRSSTRRRKAYPLRAEDLDLTANVLVASQPKPKPSHGNSNGNGNGNGNSNDSDEETSEAEQHMPLAVRDHALVARAFAGDDVVAEFAREKDDMAQADDDKVIDNTLPGWGSWVGDGVSAREKKRHQGRFLTRVEGIKRKDRKDAKLDRVIINEKRVKKVARWAGMDDQGEIPGYHEAKGSDEAGHNYANVEADCLG